MTDATEAQIGLGDAGGAVAQNRPVARRRQWPSLLVVVLTLILVAAILPPFLFLLRASFYTTTYTGAFDKFTTQYWTDLVSNPLFFSSVVNTTVYALGAAAVAISIGTLQAWIVERTNTPLRQYVFLFSIFSLGIPSVLYTISFLLLLGKAGPVNAIMDYFFATGRTGVNVYSMWGMIVVEGIDFAPLSFLLLSSVFRSTDPAFEEASLMSGAGIITTFRRITMRLATPGVLALLILIFIRAFESFETPALVGRPGNVKVLTTVIFDSVQGQSPPNYGQAGAFSMMLLGIVVVLLIWYGQLSHYAEKYQTITGRGYRPRVTDLGKWKYATAAILVLIFMLVIGFPVGIVVYASLQPFYEGLNLESLSRLTLDNYRTVIVTNAFREPIMNTLMLGIATASIVGPFTALCAWLAVRRRPGAFVLDQLASMPLIFPSVVMGLAMMQVFLVSPIPLYGTLVSIIIASSIRFLPYGMRYSYAGLLQIHKELEDASSMSGARQATTFVRIVLPLIAPALISCWLLVFLVSTKAVSIPILLSGPDSQVLAVMLFDQWQNGQTTELAAMGVAWGGVMTLISAAFYVMARRYGLKL
jgi:iron(III) transport system permease protein